MNLLASQRICVVPPGHPLPTLSGAQSVHIISKSSEWPSKPAHLYSVARAPTASSLRCLLDTQHKYMPIQYNGPSHGCENENFQVKIVIFFCYFCVKQGSRAPARTATLRRPQRAHISAVPCRNNNNNVYTPENPTFYIKYGSRGPKSHRNASLR